MLALLLLFAAPLPLRASLGDESIVEFAPAPQSLALVQNGNAAPLIVDDAADWPGVVRAAHDLQADIERVSGARASFVNTATSPARDVVLIGTLGRSPLIDQLVREKKIDASAIAGRWEAFLLQVVEQPLPGVDRALVIAGSDKRGTIYGIYELSQQIGVSPWYWWADVPPAKHDALFVKAGASLVDRGPVVKYRGIFLNDEAPALSGWAKENFGGLNSKFYAHVFELILRLRGNYLWPAMWGNAFNEDDPENPRLADEMGIVMGTSHHEPMLRAQQEWKRHGTDPWDYTKNADVLKKFWADGVRRNRAFESITTIGMRGDGDEPMSEEANVALLEKIVAEQREILAREVNPDVTRVPQLWALYKEVQAYYEKGMRVPDDVTLLWCDDNWGNIRRLPTPAERARSGGAGVYYHFDYVGGPRSYRWLNTNPLPKIWEQMHLAWRYDANRIWIVNVGDLKPMEFPTEFFLTYAWDPARWPAERIAEFGKRWAAREFGPQHADEIADIVARYLKYNGWRKPELLEPRTFSLVNYREAQNVVDGWRDLERRAEAIDAALPAEAKDAFFELVLHPVKACAIVNELYVTAGLNRIYAVQGRASTNALADRARELFTADATLTHEFNDVLAGGKWRHMMDQTHLGYTYWNEPLRNAMPAVQEIQPSASAAMGVAIEGAERSWPDWGPVQPVLPESSVFDRQPRWIEVFNRGEAPLTFSVETSAPWLTLKPAAAEVTKPDVGATTNDTRLDVSVDWSAAPAGNSNATITLRGSDGTNVTVSAPIFNPAQPRPETVHGLVETDGCVSIEAEHFTHAIAPTGREWKRIPDFGRGLSGMTPFPVDVRATAAAPSADGMRLEYAMHLFHAGDVSVQVVLAPTQKFQPGPGFRYAISFDDETPQVLNVHADESLQAWERSVSNGVTEMLSHHTLAQPGDHVLKFWVLDPGLVLEKIVVDTHPGGKPAARPSYFGPPESFHAR